jgi:hypothetical protein
MGGGGRLRSVGGWWGEGAGVDQAAGAYGQFAAQRGQARRQDGVGFPARTQQVVRDAAPGAAVAGWMGDPCVDVPAASGRDRGRAQFARVQRDGALVIGARVPLDAVAALAAGTGLGGAQQAAGAASGHPQDAGVVGAGCAAVPPAAGIVRGVHGGEDVSRHAAPCGPAPRLSPTRTASFAHAFRCPVKFSPSVTASATPRTDDAHPVPPTAAPTGF